jgi:hypothetical protein
MDLLDKHFPHDAHVLIFDNATTHTKCAEGALSACYMPKNPSKVEKNWEVEVNQHDAMASQCMDQMGKSSKQKSQ